MEATHTFDQAWADQKNLSLLCADRDLDTNELFRPNAFYGIDLLLKRYVGLQQDYQLKMIIPHGIVFDPEYVWEAEKNSFLPTVLSYPDYRDAGYSKTTDKQVISSASPFLYLVEMLSGQPKLSRQGTIFFPQHSTHHVTIIPEFEQLAESLVRLPSKFRPVTVCMYWRDYNLGHQEPFERNGLRIVSAGHIYDPAFLYRFYHLCSLHKYAASNNLGSHIFYSAKAGCNYFHLDGGDIQRTIDPLHEIDVSEETEDVRGFVQTAFTMQDIEQSESKMAFIDRFIGSRHLKSRDELTLTIKNSERLYKRKLISIPGLKNLSRQGLRNLRNSALLKRTLKI